MKLKLIATLLTCLTLSSFAGNFNFKESLIWTDLKTVSSAQPTNKKYFYFATAEMNAELDFLPQFSKRFKIGSNEIIDKVVILNAVYEPIIVPNNVVVQGMDYIKTAIIPEFRTSIASKQRYGNIAFVPMRKNNNTGIVEKLVSFELQVTTRSGAISKSSIKKRQKSVSSSVLAQGEWFKIGVTRDGVYKVTYAFLQNLGIDMSLVDPNNIRLYGNGGGMLPEENIEFRYDDLMENAIEVVDGNDGSFDKNDYFLFYGQGPNRWVDFGNNRFRHEKHRYSDTTYYFINTDLGRGKRIANQGSTTGKNYTVTSFNDFDVHDVDQINLVKSGRSWYGETFDAVTSYNFSFNFPNIDLSDSVYIRARVAAKSRSTSNFTFTSNGKSMNVSVPLVSFEYPSPGGAGGSGDFAVRASNSLINVGVSYNKPLTSSRGWLDFIELNVRRQLAMNGIQMTFRDFNSVGAGRVSEFVLNGVNSNINIWDVSNPINVANQTLASNAAGTARFTVGTTELREFIAFTEPLTTVYAAGRVANQNLHALGQQDMLIISHPLFINQAQTLANFHEDEGMRVAVVNVFQIYNEFSSGAQDLVGIRDFIRMFYNRSTTPDDLPKYLLMFGDASYDLKDRISGNTNFVPSYQSNESFSLITSYVSDDYYGLLDENEGRWSISEDIDIGIGRIPVKNREEAEAVVNKIINYKNTSTMRDWRNSIHFVADDEDNSTHMVQAEALADTVLRREPDYNRDKIFLDAYKQVSTPGGQRYPDAQDAINRFVDGGALILNYTGHGGESGWAHERILEVSDINSWDNFDRLPLFVTATCEFSRFDDPKRVSGGEYVLLNPDGGGIALFTTVRTVFSGDNFDLNNAMYQNVFEKEQGKHLRLGDIFKKIKNQVNTLNTRNFTLLGDPALSLNFPELDIQTTSINGKPITEVDTVQALEKMTIEGYVSDKNGNKLTGYNGILYPTIFDKAVEIVTLNNDNKGAFSFDLQKNKLFKGKVSIKNGEFSFSFIVPKDIQYEIGNGKISYYGQNAINDANGYYKGFKIGGTSSSAAIDNQGPNIELYMNDESFVFGGITDENPIMLANLSDQHGINMVGTGLGHDIIAVLDQNTENAIVLNDFYEADIDSYQSGSINYAFADLSEGKHTLTLKAWDVYNNSSESTIEFVVQKSKEIEIANVLNYPNPFTTRTEFWFEHNQPSRLLDVKVQIFTVSGKLIKTIDRLIQTEGFSQNQVNPIQWNGRDEYGDKLGRGVYLYKLKVRSRSNGSVAEKIEKLVIL